MSGNKILVFAGSARTGSFSKKLAAFAAKALGEAGGKVTLIDLANYPAGVYNGDDEASHGIPEKMKEFKALIASHDGLFIATPEYNGSVPPLLVNVLSWASRPEGKEASCAAFAGKKVAISASSPGGLGGVRVVPRLRDYMAELGAITIPGFATVPQAHEAFSDEGELTNSFAVDTVKDLAERLVATA
jgi:chromate reductase